MNVSSIEARKSLDMYKIFMIFALAGVITALFAKARYGKRYKH
jgi:hypothetical protein